MNDLQNIQSFLNKEIFLQGFDFDRNREPYAIGIDPDSRGALCAVDKLGKLVGCLRFHRQYKKTLCCLFDHFEGAALLQEVMNIALPRASVIAIEKVGARPGQGVCSMFKFGRVYGYLSGLVQATMSAHGVHQERLKFVRPQVWQASFNFKGGQKKVVRDAARERWPSFKWPARSELPDTHISDGAFIAAWAAQMV